MKFGDSLLAPAHQLAVCASENKPRGGRIPELDGLRGIAILSVMLLHYFSMQGATGGPVTSALQRMVILGWSGVDLFFVLSGFLIGGILMEARESPNYFKTFYVRRIFRIFPIYYAWILAYIVLITLGGATVRAHSNSGRPEMLGFPIYAHFLFIQNFWVIPFGGLAGAWFVQMWSLAVEEQFYLICPWIVRLLSTRRLYSALAVVIVAAPILRISLLRWAHLAPWMILVSMPCRADTLAVGVLAAMLWRDVHFRARLSKQGAILHVLLGLLSLGVWAIWKWSPGSLDPMTQYFGYSSLAFFYVIVLLLVLSRPTGTLASFTRLRFLRSLGIVSYCVYIIHMAVNVLLHAILLRAPPKTSNWRGAVVTVLAAIVTYALAKLSWQFFERPLLQRGHAFRY